MKKVAIMHRYLFLVTVLLVAQSMWAADLPVGAVGFTLGMSRSAAVVIVDRTYAAETHVVPHEEGFENDNLSFSAVVSGVPVDITLIFFDKRLGEIQIENPDTDKAIWVLNYSARFETALVEKYGSPKTSDDGYSKIQKWNLESGSTIILIRVGQTAFLLSYSSSEYIEKKNSWFFKESGAETPSNLTDLL